MADYFYGAEAEQYTFYRIPKLLFTDPVFRRTSVESKLLYGLMLDRMGLSVRNSWVEEDTRRIFIYFTLEDAMEAMRCGHTKAVALFAELDKAGLIERRRQGQGKPTRIYLKNFVRRPEIQTSGNRNSALPKTGSADFPSAATNDTEKSDTEIHLHRSENTAGTDAMERYRQIMRRNIEYDTLCRRKGCDREILADLLQLMTDTVCTTRPTVRIGKEDIPADTVRGRLLGLNAEHIVYVLERLQENTTQVRNIRAYLLTALYNAPVTKNTYYAAQVSHDLYG